MLVVGKEGFIHVAKIDANIDFCEQNVMTDVVKQWEFVNLGI